MRFVTAHDHQLQIRDATDATTAASRGGGVHELLHHPDHPVPWSAGFGIANCELRITKGMTDIADRTEIADRGLRIADWELSKRDDALRIADREREGPTALPFRNSQFAIRNPGSAILFDPTHTLNPPAIESLGWSLDRVLIVRPKTRADLLWAMAECLKCPGVGTVIGPVDARLSRVEARKLQLAAESGGTTALLLRPLDVRRGAKQQVYAAATRWLVAPMPSDDRLVQRWEMRLLHGHGGRELDPICLERHREAPFFRTRPLHVHRQTDRMRPASELAG
jgi:hypothetical protein